MLHQKKVKVIENFYFSLSSCSPVHYAKQAWSCAAAARWAVIHFQYVGGPSCQCTQGIIGTHKNEIQIMAGICCFVMYYVCCMKKAIFGPKANVHFKLKLRGK